LVLGEGDLPVFFAVYENPSDFPGQFVVRQWLWGVPCQVWAVAGTLEEVRGKLPRQLLNIGRMDGDDPAIKEVWCSQRLAHLLRKENVIK